MVRCKQSAIWMRGAVVAFAGFCGVVLGSSMSLAQYPGSAGNFTDGALGASSSASSGSTGGSSSSSGGGNSSGSSDSSASGSTDGSNSYGGGDGSDGHDSFKSPTGTALPSKKAVRKRLLIRKFRLEFAKTMIIEASSKRPLRALYADVYLNQFSKELDDGLDQRADEDSLVGDLGLVRDALNNRLDKVIVSYGGDAPRRTFFSKTAVVGGSPLGLRTEVQRLKLKHELLKFGEYSLQAMGYFAE